MSEPETPPRVFIILEHPDMTYYGDAMIHGVFATEAEAKAYAESHDLDIHEWGTLRH